MAHTEQAIRYAVADDDGALVAAVIETTVYTYPGENAPVLVAETAAYLENQLRDSGRLWTDLPASATAPEPGDDFPS